MRPELPPVSARMVAWAESNAARTGALKHVRDGGDVEPLRQKLGLDPQLSAAELRQAAAEALKTLSAERSEHVASHQRANLEARSAQKKATFDGSGSALNFRLDATQKKSAVDAPVDAAAKSFEGPEPILAKPNQAAVARAQLKLRALGPTGKLSTNETKALLDQTLYGAREVLRKDLTAGDKIFTPENIAGACGFGQAASAFALQEMGISPDKLHLHQAVNSFPGEGTFNHAFLVAQMPDGKNYLIDPTFRQFFNARELEKNHIGSVGAVMRETEKGSKIADQILSKGYVELTPDVAREYARALSAGAHGNFEPRDYLQSTMRIDYDRDETPSLPAPPIGPRGAS